MNIQSLTQPFTSILDPPPSPHLQPQESPLSEVEDQNFCLDSFSLEQNFLQDEKMISYQSQMSEQTQMQEQITPQKQQTVAGKRSYQQFMGISKKKQIISFAMKFSHPKPRKLKH